MSWKWWHRYQIPSHKQNYSHMSSDGQKWKHYGCFVVVSALMNCDTELITVENLIMYVTLYISHNFKCDNLENVRTGEKSAEARLLRRLIFAIEWDYCECCSSWPWHTFSSSNTLSRQFWQVNAGKMQTLQPPSDRKSGTCHRMAPLRMLCIMTLTYIFKATNFEMWISRKRWELATNAQIWLCIGWYLQSNMIIANAVLHDLNLHFQGQTFSFPK